MGDILKIINKETTILKSDLLIALKKGIIILTGLTCSFPLISISDPSLTLLCNYNPNEIENAREYGSVDKIVLDIRNSNLPKEEKIAELYTYGILENKKIPYMYKEPLINAFCKRVIYPYGQYFTDKLIDNVYAVASTEKLEELSANYTFLYGYSFDHLSGLFVPSINTSFIRDIDKFSEVESVYAHEQLHNIRNYGNGIYLPSVIEEAGTALFSLDGTYKLERNIYSFIGYIIGYDTLAEIYFNKDKLSLEKELGKYMSDEDVKSLLSLLKTNLSVSRNEVSEEAFNQRLEGIKKYLQILYEGKYTSINDKAFDDDFILSENIFENEVAYDNYLRKVSIHIEKNNKKIDCIFDTEIDEYPDIRKIYYYLNLFEKIDDDVSIDIYPTGEIKIVVTLNHLASFSRMEYVVSEINDDVINNIKSEIDDKYLEFSYFFGLSTLLENSEDNSKNLKTAQLKL